MKILKHEWLRTRNLLGGITGIAALVAVASALLSATGWPLLSSFGVATGMAATIGLVPALQVALTVDHYRSSFGRTGYFTQTLPVRGSRLYLAKLAFILVVSVVGVVVSAVLGAISWLGYAVATGTQLNPITALRDVWATFSDVTPGWVMGLGLALIALLILSWPVLFYFSVAIGSEKRFNQYGAGGPVLVYVIVYLANQVLMAISIVAIPVAIGMDGGRLGIIPVNLVGDLVAGINTEAMPLGLIPPLVLVTAFCLWRSLRSWNHNVSLA